MKLVKGRKNSSTSIVSILLLGLLVLVASTGVFLMHVWQVRRTFEKQMMEATTSNMQNAVTLIEEQSAEIAKVVSQAAEIWEESLPDFQEEDILLALDRYCKMEKFDHLYFYKNNGELFGDGNLHIQTDVDEYERQGYVEKFVIRARMVNSFNKEEEKHGAICFMAPIIIEDQNIGSLIAILDTQVFLDSEVYQKMSEKGDTFLINQSGDIFSEKSTILQSFSKNMIEIFDNIYIQLTGYSADSKDKSTITAIKYVLSRQDYYKIAFVDKKGVRDYVEFMEIPTFEDLFLVYFYPETNYTDMIRPVITKSLVACICIMLLTIGMMVYIWATSKRANDTIASLAYDDIVTGGKNDNYFRVAASKIIWSNDNIPYVIARFDVVNFRYINEAYGHARADELLKLVVEEAMKLFHENKKEICCRMNSDQFVLLAKNDSEFDDKCEALTVVLNDRARDIGIKFPIRLKMGLYVVRKEDYSIDLMIDRANAARKSLIGNEKVLTVLYSDKITKQMYKTDQIESEMESAMNNHEFKVFVQPKWDITNDRIYGGEALVRWIKNDGSMVYPDEFIPVFEKNGFIEKLDLYMLEQVCAKMRELIDAGREIFPVSVNQSRILLHNPEYITQVSKILRRYRVPSKYIELEVTETVFLDERNHMIQTMNKLKEMDVQISMDDFGSGYSSLNMLKDIPFDVIKIDREFFSESTTSDSSILILRKIIEMAEGLGIRVLCEGVENQEQVDLLKSLGCQFVQGYFFSKPISAEDFVEKYSHEKEGGKEYYESLYDQELEKRAKLEEEKERIRQEQSASSVVEKFKKVYVPKKQVDKESDKQEKKLSTEEQKLLMAAEREKKKAEAKQASDQKDGE